MCATIFFFLSLFSGSFYPTPSLLHILLATDANLAGFYPHHDIDFVSVICFGLRLYVGPHADWFMQVIDPRPTHQENMKMLIYAYLYLVALILEIRNISEISEIFCLFWTWILYDKAQIKKTVFLSTIRK